MTVYTLRTSYQIEQLRNIYEHLNPIKSARFLMNLLKLTTKAVICTTISLRDLCVIDEFCYKITKCSVYNI